MLQTAPAQLATFDVLDEAGCEDWVWQVLLLERHWQRRHPEVPFFTLGMAAYLDWPTGAYRERKQRQQTNLLLTTYFTPLLQQVVQTMADHLGQPVRLAEDAALPGFHIYLPHPAFGQSVASIHRDLQYRDVFPDIEVGEEDVLTFTLPLSTPEGSGLTLWDEESGMREFVRYRSGQMVVHSGLATHQAVLQCDGDMERITLQGHGIRVGEGFVVYW